MLACYLEAALRMFSTQSGAMLGPFIKQDGFSLGISIETAIVLLTSSMRHIQVHNLGRCTEQLSGQLFCLPNSGIPWNLGTKYTQLSTFQGWHSVMHSLKYFPMRSPGMTDSACEGCPAWQKSTLGLTFCPLLGHMIFSEELASKSI